MQLDRVYEDGKTFVDALPRTSPEAILEEYLRAHDDPGFDLRAFVTARFDAPAEHPTGYRSRPGVDIQAHIDELWNVLERAPVEPAPHSSLLPLPYRYMVPGGRFREIYYWDSYFTMLGLEQSGRHDLAVDMVRNFAFLIDRYGHIPNGNRTYYLSRSQPPFFAAMVNLIAAREGDGVYGRYLPQLQREYDFWMEGAATLARGRRTGAWCDCTTGRSSIATGTTGTRRARRPTARTSRPRASQTAHPRRCTATCAQLPRAAGISVRAGSRTGARSRRSGPSRSCRWT